MVSSNCVVRFSIFYALKKHQKSTRYCLKIQNTVSQHLCEYCGKHLSTKRWLLNHYQTCRIQSFYRNQRIEGKSLFLEAQLEEQTKFDEEKIQIQDNLENIAIKAIQRPTTTNNMNKTQINNFIRNMQPITTDHLIDHAPNLTIEHVQKGVSGYAEYALEYPLKDRVACVDYAMRKIKFKDNEGKLVTDPEMVRLVPMFFESIKKKSSELVYNMN